MTHPPFTRRRLLHKAAALACSAGAAAPLFSMSRAARASTHFPSRPITLWVPWPAGGATDISLRLLAELASRTLGQRVLIENRSGAGGTLVMPVLSSRSRSTACNT